MAKKKNHSLILFLSFWFFVDCQTHGQIRLGLSKLFHFLFFIIIIFFIIHFGLFHCSKRLSKKGGGRKWENNNIKMARSRMQADVGASQCPEILTSFNIYSFIFNFLFISFIYFVYSTKRQDFSIC
jgi:heme/copper-type cytochrome/quinol oxidase subunit 2